MLTVPKGEVVVLDSPPVPILGMLKILVEKAGVLAGWLNEWVNGCCPIVGEG